MGYGERVGCSSYTGDGSEEVHGWATGAGDEETAVDEKPRADSMTWGDRGKEQGQLLELGMERLCCGNQRTPSMAAIRGIKVWCVQSMRGRSLWGGGWYS